MSMDMLRQLKIKTSSVQRIRKELRFYEEDAVKEQNRFDQLKASGIDSYRLQQAENVLSEAKAMVPDSKQRLETAIRDLRSFMAQESEALEETKEYQDAQELLTEVQPLVL